MYIGQVSQNKNVIEYKILSKDCESLRGSVLLRGNGKSFDVIHAQESVIIPNVSHDPQVAILSKRNKDELQGSLFIAPIQTLDGTACTFTIDRSHLREENIFSEEDYAFLKAVTKKLEIAEKSVALEQKLHAIRKVADEMFNKNKENVYKVGMNQLLSSTLHQSNKFY